MFNKFHVKRVKGGNTEEKCEQYRIYRNKLNHVMRSAERFAEWAQIKS